MGGITVFLDFAFMLVTFYGVYRIQKNVKWQISVQFTEFVTFLCNFLFYMCFCYDNF